VNAGFRADRVNTDVQKVRVDYAPRRWAMGLHDSFLRYACLLLHRRAGKTTAVVNHHIRAATDDLWELDRLQHLMPAQTKEQLKPLLRGRQYGHIMPTRKQAKEAAWDMCKWYSSKIPGAKANETELLIRFPPTELSPVGAKLQLFGADDPDSLRGLGPSGVSFDEYSQQPPEIFGAVLSKALADHLGYAIFLGTIQGRDHLLRMYEATKDNSAWFTLWQDIEKSLATESGPTVAALARALEDDRALILSGQMTQEQFDQEWYLSADAGSQGLFFGAEMGQAEKDGRIREVPFDPAIPVDTDWDLGMDDAMAIWFSQSPRGGTEVRLIDYYEASGEGIPHYVALLQKKQGERGFVYGKHYPPHDIAVRELGTGKSRKDAAAALGLKFEDPVLKLEFADGIDAVRRLLPRCYFDKTHCRRGIDGLRQYKKKFNPGLNEYTGSPVHNWASHPADAFRTLAVRYQPPRQKRDVQDVLAGMLPTGSPFDWMRG
jgi:phage terminase large subunit